MMDRRSFMGIGMAAAAMAAAPAQVLAAGRSSAAGPILTRDEVRLNVMRWGAGEPVLFLAGWTLPSEFWSYQMLSLAGQGFEAIAYDRRGHGRSADPGRGYDHDTLADDLAAVLDGLGRDRVTLVGHSMAAMEIARYFARHGGRRVAKVVLVGAITPFLMKTADNPSGIDREVLAAARRPLERDFPGWIQANAAPFFVPETSPDMIEWGKALMLQTSLFAAAELARANAETDFRADLPRIHVPTLVIHGDRDVSAPLHLTARPTAALIPGSDLRVYEGAPHGLPLTHVERLNREIVGFARPD